MIEFKHGWLVIAAVLPQVIVFQIPAAGKLVPDEFIPYLLVGSQIILAGFVSLNLDKTGVGILGIGLLANLLVILGNGGWMPTSPEIVRRILPALPADFPLENRRLGLSKDWILPAGNIRFPWLADRFTLPGWFPYHAAFSLGDILIAFGAFILFWSLGDAEK